VFANDLITAEVVMEEVLKTEHSLDQVRDLIQREVNGDIEDTVAERVGKSTRKISTKMGRYKGVVSAMLHTLFPPGNSTRV
jgi:hypothetical protein